MRGYDLKLQRKKHTTAFYCLCRREENISKLTLIILKLFTQISLYLEKDLWPTTTTHILPVVFTDVFSMLGIICVKVEEAQVSKTWYFFQKIKCNVIHHFTLRHWLVGSLLKRLSLLFLVFGLLSTLLWILSNLCKLVRTTATIRSGVTGEGYLSLLIICFLLFSIYLY